jgi:hypothetical protein
MRFVARLRAWQMFLLFGPVPAVAGGGMAAGSAALSLDATIPLVLFGLLLAVCLSLVCGWLWSVGIVVNRSLPEAVRSRTTFFNAASILFVTYVLFFISVFWTDWVPWTVLAPLHASAMLVQLYVLGFVTRALVMSRFGSLRVLPVIGTFLLLANYLVGVWIVQPWVNRVEARPETEVR